MCYKRAALAATESNSDVTEVLFVESLYVVDGLAFTEIKKVLCEKLEMWCCREVTWFS